MAQDCGGNDQTLSGDPFGASTFTVTAVTKDCEVRAQLSEARYAVTPSSTGNGTISPSTVQSIGHGERAVFTLSPNSGFEIDYFHPDWGSCGGGFPRSIYLQPYGNEYTTNRVESACTVKANFKPLSGSLPPEPPVLTLTDLDSGRAGFIVSPQGSGSDPITQYVTSCQISGPSNRVTKGTDVPNAYSLGYPTPESNELAN